LVVDDGMHTALLNFSGNYTVSNFILADDTNGGTLIIDPPATKIVSESTRMLADNSPSKTHAASTSPPEIGSPDVRLGEFSTQHDSFVFSNETDGSQLHLTAAQAGSIAHPLPTEIASINQNGFDSFEFQHLSGQSATASASRTSDSEFSNLSWVS